MTQRAQGWENWPWDLALIYRPHGDDGPGRAQFTAAPTGRQEILAELRIDAWDHLAQEHMKNRAGKTGQPMSMPDGRTLHVPYIMIDDAADAYQRSGPAQGEARQPISKLKTVENVELDNVPYDYFEQLIQAHLQRRAQEPAVRLELGEGKTMNLPFDFLDGMAKDWVGRQRAAMISAGWFPELVIREGGDSKGPRAVEGRPDAFGHMPGQTTPGSTQPATPPAPQAPPDHPGAENRGLV